MDITKRSDKAADTLQPTRSCGLFCASYMKLVLSCFFSRFRDNLLELRIYYESLTFSDVRQVPSYDLYSLLGKQHILLSFARTLIIAHHDCLKIKK